MMYVSAPADDAATSRRISAAMSPERSATPTPIITTRMIPMAVKPMNTGTGDVKRKRIPSAVRRPWMLTVWVTIS